MASVRYADERTVDPDPDPDLQGLRAGECRGRGRGGEAVAERDGEWPTDGDGGDAEGWDEVKKRGGSLLDGDGVSVVRGSAFFSFFFFFFVRSATFLGKDNVVLL